MIKTITIPSKEIVREYCSLSQSEQLGAHESTMTLYWCDGEFPDGRGEIEWDIPELDETAHIGVWTDNKELTDFDGVFELPHDAVTLLRSCGIIVSDEFTDLEDSE